MSLEISVHLPGVSARVLFRTPNTTRHSAGSSAVGSGTTPARSNSTPFSTSMVASPPSSRIMFGPAKPCADQSKICSVHHQYSSNVSPFQANTGEPWGSSGVPVPTTTAAAASSWVEKILQLAQRTSAPRATSVSIKTAVCTVMCREPVMRAPFRGCSGPYSSRRAMRPGISCSAKRIWCRPASARERSATLNWSGVAVNIGALWHGFLTTPASYTPVFRRLESGHPPGPRCPLISLDWPLPR